MVPVHKGQGSCSEKKKRKKNSVDQKIKKQPTFRCIRTSPIMSGVKKGDFRKENIILKASMEYGFWFESKSLTMTMSESLWRTKKKKSGVVLEEEKDLKRPSYHDSLQLNKKKVENEQRFA